MKENRKLLKEVLKDIRHDMTDEEVLNLLADSKISVSPEKEKEKYTLGQRAADTIAKFAGSWAFIFSFTGGLILWMVINTILASKAFDAYPFILLNLVLSCVAAIQAPLIMMSQNRQEEKDRRRAENDYKVNLKTEIMIEDLYDKVNAILIRQSQIEKLLSEQKEKIFYNECGCEFDGQFPVRLQADGKQENKNFELQKRKTAGTFRTADRICGIGCVSISYAGT